MKTSLEQAVVEMKQIKEAAEIAAMAKLAKSMPQQFDKFLKEELSKKGNIQESTVVGKTKESQKVNESILDVPQESTVEEGWANEELTSEQSKEVGADDQVDDCGCDDKNGEVLDMTGLSIDDIEQAYNEASSDDEIEVVKDAGSSDAEAEGDELDKDAIMNDIDAELAGSGEGAEEIEASVDSVEGGTPEVAATEVDPIEVLRKMKDELIAAVDAIDDKMNTEGFSKEFDGKMTEMYGENCKETFGEQKYNEMFDVYKTRKMDEMKKTAQNKEAVVETQEVVTEELVNQDALPAEGQEEKEIDEAHGIALASNKKVNGNQAPQLDNKQYAKNKVRSAVQESDKKFTALLDENKKLSKQINENKKQVNDLSGMIKEYQNALDKYRKQLSEMAVFNNNLAHVNNILVNESLVLTSKEKKQVIEKFKGVSSLEESEKTYKAVLSEMTAEKKNLVESIEEKVSNVVEGSSANRLGTVVENTAYVNEHVNKIKNLISYTEKRRK